MDAVNNSKPKPRKSMRVATIFTGVAAATVGMAPVANAQGATPAAHKSTPRHSARQLRRAAVPASSHYGRIQISPWCAEPASSPAHPHWLHVWVGSPRGEGGREMDCYGYTGTWFSPPGIGISSECGGNNFGVLAGSGGAWDFHFHQGTTYHGLFKRNWDVLGISGWAGNDKCGIT